MPAMQRVNTETNEVLEQIEDKALRTALKLLFLQSEQQHEENRGDMQARHVANVNEMEALRAFVKSGFPDGDPLLHKQYHNEIMRRFAERTEFWRAMRLTLAKWGLIGLASLLLFKFFGIKFPVP